MMALGAPFELSSSPPSSPSVGPTDSSPASSPALAPIILDSPPNTAGPSHPFAASSRSVRRPPVYEKKIATRTAISPSNFMSRAPGSRAFGGPHEEDEYLNDTESGRPVNVAPDDSEASMWDEAIANAIDKGSGTIELIGREITYIPQSIGDLGNFFVLAAKTAQANPTDRRLFSRTKTTPISTSSVSRSFERATSISESCTGLARDEVQLYLSSNKIRKLPRELFNLTKMTVLSLRGNQLTYIPAAVSNLTNLRELNVSYNRLTYLPSEMLNMKLPTMWLFPNPFRSEPCTSTEAPRQAGSLVRRRSMTRIYSRPDARAVSPITHPCFHVPSLFELCIRVLVSPHLPLTAAGNTNIAELYTLPIPGEWGSRTLPPSVREVLNACVPESASAPKSMSPSATPGSRKSHGDNGEEIMGLGVCPNPLHPSKTVFVRYVEERFTWENIPGVLDVANKVPFKWRGCSKGCLAFLDSDRAAAHGPSVRLGLRNASENTQMTVNVDNDVEMDELVVRPVSLVQNGFGDLDFENDA